MRRISWAALIMFSAVCGGTILWLLLAETSTPDSSIVIIAPETEEHAGPAPGPRSRAAATVAPEAALAAPPPVRSVGSGPAPARPVQPSTPAPPVPPVEAWVLPEESRAGLQTTGDIVDQDAEAIALSLYGVTQRCAARLRARLPATSGKVVIEVSVANNGAGAAAVGGLRLAQDDVGDPEFAHCLRRATHALSVPIRAEVARGGLTVPFSLQP